MNENLIQTMKIMGMSDEEIKQMQIKMMTIISEKDVEDLEKIEDDFEEISFEQIDEEEVFYE